MDVSANIHGLMDEIGPLRISRSAYDTAWVARLAEIGEPIGSRALEWLRANQLPDGGWGSPYLVYHHERLINTLAAITVLARQGEPIDSITMRRAKVAAETAIAGLEADPAGSTIGFEMLVPSLMAEVGALGVQINSNGRLDSLAWERQAKLSSIPGKKITRYFTPSFSSEMVGLDGLSLLDADNLQSDNGSVSYSPSATAFFATYVRPGDPMALSYLEQVVDDDGAVPYVGPVEVFDRGWTLWNLGLAGVQNLDPDTFRRCEEYLDFLMEEWIPGKGIASARGLILLDGDDSAVAWAALALFDRQVDLEGLLAFETAYHFMCYPLESDPSLSTNVHILHALRLAGLPVQDTRVQKVLRFLQYTQVGGLYWLDKWHASPFYTSSHAVIACAGFADNLVQNTVAWILATQHPDGGWGYYLSTAEETAGCLQALVAWRRAGHQVPDDVLERGAAWLAAHADPPYPPLWIGKSLYAVPVPIRSAVLSALVMVEGL